MAVEVQLIQSSTKLRQDLCAQRFVSASSRQTKHSTTEACFQAVTVLSSLVF